MVSGLHSEQFSHLGSVYLFIIVFSNYVLTFVVQVEATLSTSKTNKSYKDIEISARSSSYYIECLKNLWLLISLIGTNILCQSLSLVLPVQVCTFLLSALGPTEPCNKSIRELS